MVTMMRPQRAKGREAWSSFESCICCALFTVCVTFSNASIWSFLYVSIDVLSCRLATWWYELILNGCFWCWSASMLGANNIYGMLSLLSVSGLDLQHSLIIYLEQLLIWMIYTDMTWPILVASVASTEGSNMLTGIVLWPHCANVMSLLWLYRCCNLEI